MKRTYKIKKTLSLRQFITEFGEDFSKHMKQRLLELGARCVLTRDEDKCKLDLKHIEHTKYDCSNLQMDAKKCKKEYAYGQFIMKEGALYFSEKCLESPEVMQTPTVKDIFDKMDSIDILVAEDTKAKKVDDENIDFVIDSILRTCPEVSEEHMAIIAKYKA